jgi:hypothetical protein
MSSPSTRLGVPVSRFRYRIGNASASGDGSSTMDIVIALIAERMLA